MGCLEIRGNRKLDGKIEVQGSKNAALPILAACMAGEGSCEIENCPSIGDVDDTLKIMEKLGCQVERCGKLVRIDASSVDKYELEEEEAVRIRSSVLFLGALLGRMKRAVLPLPGGCAIGARPVDLHRKALECLGAQFTVGGAFSDVQDYEKGNVRNPSETDPETESGKNPAGTDHEMAGGKIHARAEHLKGGRVCLPFPSVGATENTILAAVQAEGETVIEHAAREPEIDELCEFLNRRGAMIRRERDGSIRICGGRPLGPVHYRIQADRIVTGTYLLAGAAAGGKVCIGNDSGQRLQRLIRILRQMGAEVVCGEGEIFIRSEGRLRAVPYLETAPYPGFPTDLQSPLMAVLCRAQGKSCICETIFENRFRTAQELVRMGAKIRIRGNRAFLEGVSRLYPAELTAPDLRGGAALVVAALQTQGVTRISHTDYIDRGYENIERDMRLLGADIKRYR